MYALRALLSLYYIVDCSSSWPFPLAAVAALSFLRSPHRVLPSIKGIIRARRLCVYLYTYICNELVSKMYFIPMYYNAQPLLST